MFNSEIMQHEKITFYLPQIKNLISCPDGIFQDLYLKTLFNIMKSGHLFDEKLKLTITALKLRRGMLFPKNAGTEKISAEEAQWTYAIFSAILLKEIYGLQQDKKLDAFLSKTLTENIVNWLKNNDYLFNQWQEAITGKTDIHNEIEKVIQLAIEKNNVTPTYPPSTNLSDKLIAYLLKNISQNAEQIFKMKIGIFINIALIDNFLSETGLSKPALIQALEKDHWLILNDNTPYHIVTPRQLQDRRTLQGIVLSSDALPEALQNLPLNTYFQKPIVL